MSKDVNLADIVYDLQFGDSGKGKVSNFLSSQKNKDGTPYYNYVVRWGGGANAGHTVYVDSKKYKTHLVPSGVFHGIKSFIGPGCVLNLKSLKEEFDYLDQNGFDSSLVKISQSAHIVTDEHIEIDKEKLAKKLGTTSRGIAPAYSDKFARKGIQFKDIASSDNFWRKYILDEPISGNILCEGAQGFYLDINWGNYPYITSSETLPYAACSVGFSPKKINNIFGVAKIYETRSGEDPLFPESLFDNPELSRICDIGKEFGVTTGRKRKVNYLNLDRLIFALNTAGGNKVIISKCDVLEDANVYKLFFEEKLIDFSGQNPMINMKEFISNILIEKCKEVTDIYFSHTPESVENLTIG